jgi:SAM-dependent methyltransferase
MGAHREFAEDLPRLAAEVYARADRLCQSCAPTHALWPYIRLARASMGAEVASSRLQSVLSALIADGRRKVLIAGAADTGLFALVARAAGAHPADIVVLDRCETPLVSCRLLAQTWSLPIETMRQDLTALDIQERFDLVLMHGTLLFVATDRRADVLTRLRRALRPDGRMVLLVSTNAPNTADLMWQSRNDYADGVIAELDRLGVPLPVDREVFRSRLRTQQERASRKDPLNDPEDVRQLLSCAGFRIREECAIGVQFAEPVQSLVATIGKRRFLLIAEPV